MFAVIIQNIPSMIHRLGKGGIFLGWSVVNVGHRVRHQIIMGQDHTLYLSSWRPSEGFPMI